VSRERYACCPDSAQIAAAAVTPADGGQPPLGLPLAALVPHLYADHGLSTYQIAEIVGMDRQRVGRLLNKAGVPVKARGAGRARRVDAARVI
jgi:hypothetical protein